MRNSFNLASVAGAMLAMSAAANAQLPAGAFDQLAVDPTTKAVSMPSYCQSQGGTEQCSVIASGEGFLQIMVGATAGVPGGTAPGQDTYVMTFVADQTAAKSFFDQSYVKLSNNTPTGAVNQTNPGIAAVQTIVETDAVRGGGFESTTQIATSSWAKTALNTTADIKIGQNLVDLGGTFTGQPTPTVSPTAVNDDGDNFFSDFSFESIAGGNGGMKMEIGQIAGLYAVGGDQADKQTFAFREKRGVAYTTTANATGITIGADTMTWAAGDDIKAIWMGQRIVIPNITDAGDSMTSNFGYVAFDNLSDTNPAISASGFGAGNAAGPWDGLWDGEFGTAPCLSDPSGAGCI